MGKSSKMTTVKHIGAYTDARTHTHPGVTWPILTSLFLRLTLLEAENR